jgi:hypothetical protein
MSAHIACLERPSLLMFHVKRRYYDYNCFVSIPLAPFHPQLRGKFTQFKQQVSHQI